MVTSTRTDTAAGVEKMTATVGGGGGIVVTLAMFAIVLVFAEKKEEMEKYEWW